MKLGRRPGGVDGDEPLGLRYGDYVPAVIAAVPGRCVCADARGLGADDPRSMDARRADILALLNGRLVTDPDTDPAVADEPTADRPAADTATGDAATGDTAGDGDAATGDTAAWPVMAGRAGGRGAAHPPAGLADHVRARDMYCRAPAADDEPRMPNSTTSSPGPTAAPRASRICATTAPAITG